MSRNALSFAFEFFEKIEDITRKRRDIPLIIERMSPTASIISPSGSLISWTSPLSFTAWTFPTPVDPSFRMNSTEAPTFAFFALAIVFVV